MRSSRSESLLLTCLVDSVALHDFREVDGSNNRDHFALPCWTSASLAAAFFSTVYHLVLGLFLGRLICLPLALLLPCLPLAFLCSLLLLVTLDPRVLLVVPVPLFLILILLATSSSAVVLCWILTPYSLAVGNFVVGYDSAVLFWLPPPILSVAPFVIDGWFVVCNLDPRERSLQQRVLQIVAFTHRRYSPVPLCDSLSCVHLRNEGSHRRLLSRRGLVVQPTLLGV